MTKAPRGLQGGNGHLELSLVVHWHLVDAFQSFSYATSVAQVWTYSGYFSAPWLASQIPILWSHLPVSSFPLTFISCSAVCGRTFVLDCISLSQAHLINWQLSVYVVHTSICMNTSDTGPGPLSTHCTQTNTKLCHSPTLHLHIQTFLIDHIGLPSH